MIDNAKVFQQCDKKDGVIMFPTTHDITPKNLQKCLYLIIGILQASNSLLIVSKPNLECIKSICTVSENYKSQLQFRFTIGSQSNDVMRFWEPNAPSFNERITCLAYTFEKGFETSVSAEPFLDNKVAELYEIARHFITNSFWIGKLRDFNKRVDMSHVTPNQNRLYVQPLLNAQTDETIIELYYRMDGLPFVRWKDSIRKVIHEKYRLE